MSPVFSVSRHVARYPGASTLIKTFIVSPLLHFFSDGSQLKVKVGHYF